MSTISVRLSNCNASDGALWCNLPDAAFENHEGTITADTFRAIQQAQRILTENPAFQCVSVASSLDAERLFTALEASDIWRTGLEQFLVYRSGVYVRLTHEDNCHAELEFNVHDRAGRPLVLAEPTEEAVA